MRRSRTSPTAGPARSTSTAAAAGSSRSQAWVDRFASWRDELQPQGRGRADRPRRASSRRARRCSKVLELDVKTALASTETDRSEPTRLVRSLEVDCDRALARFGAWYELFPRSWGGFKGVEKVLPELAALGFDVLYFPPIHPIGSHEPQGPEQRADRGEGRPGQPVGDRRRGGRPHRGQPGARDDRRLRPPGRAGAEARDRDRARLRDPVLARPPVAEGAPGLVPPPPGRDAQVRREPAQALPGHLQRQLRQRGLAGALGRAARRRPALGRRTASRSSASTTRTRSRCRSGSG